jgi:uncharacterized protein (DUF427 family)
MKATWRGQVIADSERTVEVDGYHYFPRQSVRTDLLKPSPKTDRDRQCPHGVQFYDVEAGGKRGARAAWSYEAPQGPMAKVGHWFGFWDEVEVG